MKKVCLTFSGVIRESIFDIRRNIEELKKCFDSHDVEVLFFTWSPNKNFNYDIKILEKQIDGIVDHLIIQPMKNIDEYPRTNDNNSAVQFYPIVYISNYLLKNNLKYDNVVRCRHDNYFIMNNVDDYLKDDNFYIPPCYHLPHCLYSKDIVSSHFFITSYNNFLKYSEYDDIQLKKISTECINTEQMDSRLMKKISNIEFINDSHILKFKNRNFSGKGFEAREWK